MSVSIDFFHYRLESVRFDIREFDDKEEVNSHISLNVGQSEDAILVRIAFRLFHGSPEQEMLFAAYEGAFKIKDDNGGDIPEEEIQKYAQINCAAMLFPYLREFVSETTRRAGLEPIMINSVNFIELYEQNRG